MTPRVLAVCALSWLAACSASNGLPPGGTGDDGGSGDDGAMPPPPGPDASDAGTDAPAEAQATDAGPDGDGAIPVCAPVDVSTFTPTWNAPPGPHAAQCITTQIAALITACYDINATQQSCQGWEQDPANKACKACWAAPVTATTWSPVVYIANPGQSDYFNFGGCVALGDATQLACGKAIEAAFECEMAACDAACPVPLNGAPNDIMKAINHLNKCFDNAAVGGCKTYADAASTCSTTVAGGGPAAFCFQINTDNNALSQYFTLACGS